MHPENDSNGVDPIRDSDSRKVKKSRRATDRKKVAAVARGAGSGVKILQFVLRKHPNNPKKQLTVLLDNVVLMARTGRSRPASEATKTKTGDTLFLCLDELKAENAVVRNLSELRRVHVERLIHHWTKKGHSAGTIQNKVAILRGFFNIIGKGKAIPKGDEFKAWLDEKGIQIPGPRTIVARESKSWVDNGVDVFEVLLRIREECEVTAMQLEMQLAFGLRTNESLQIILSQSDRGDVLSVIRGTKGGMPREVRFDDDPTIARWQRETIERAKVIAAKHPKGTLSIPGKTLAQSKSHFYYLVRKHGIRKDGLGVTAHGLRHQFAARRYRQITGFDTPASGGAPVAVNQDVKAVDLKASQEISIQLGHFRPSIARAYLGSFSMAERERGKRVKALLEFTEGNEAFVQALTGAGITRAWLVGAMASGVHVSPWQPLTLVVATENGEPLKAEVMVRLIGELATFGGRGVELSEFLDPSGQRAPDGAIELHLDDRRSGSSA